MIERSCGALQYLINHRKSAVFFFFIFMIVLINCIVLHHGYEIDCAT